jgi:hypothetical protein
VSFDDLHADPTAFLGTYRTYDRIVVTLNNSWEIFIPEIRLVGQEKIAVCIPRISRFTWFHTKYDIFIADGGNGIRKGLDDTHHRTRRHQQVSQDAYDRERGASGTFVTKHTSLWPLPSCILRQCKFLPEDIECPRPLTRAGEIISGDS